MVYNNLYIGKNSKRLQNKFKNLIQTKLNSPNFSSEYIIKSELIDLNIKKLKSNLDLFKNGEAGEMRIQEDYIYMDREEGKALGPSQVEKVLLFDTETKHYYEFDEKTNQKLMENKLLLRLIPSQQCCNQVQDI